MTKLIFATSNTGRFMAMQHELELAGLTHIKLEQKKLDLIEIQSMDLAAISLHKAHQAYEILQAPVLVMDGGFYMDGLNGFPGSYTHDMLDTVGVETMGKIASVLENKNCSFRSVATFIAGPDDYAQFYDTTGDVFILSDTVWPHDHPKQWSPLWRMIVPAKYGYIKPLAALNDNEMDVFLQQRRIFVGTPAMKQVVEYLQTNQRLAA